MKRLIMIFLGMILMFTLIGCNNIKPSQETTTKTTNKEDKSMNYELVLMIDSVEVNVTWEDNESVTALKALANTGISINMSKYGDFEQVGPLGKRLPSNDIEITTSPGDIVLYSSNQVVVFYGSNTWRYTKLGHINLSKSELTNLLGKNDVEVAISIK